MRSSTLVSGIRIAAIVLTLSAGRAFAGFADIQEANGATVQLNDNALASADDNDRPQVLSFDVTATDQPVKHQDAPPAHPQMDVRTTQAPVAAPLPVALLPGGVMIAASFLATRVFKRRLV